MTGTSTDRPALRRRRTLLLLVTFCLLVLLGLTALLTIRDTDPAVSSEWPRPFDPAKPFNMLGVPGVSVEQRKRAEDLLVRSLAEAHRWSDYEATKDAGWVLVPEQIPAFEHLLRTEYLADGRMLDPLHPESLVYKVKGDERIFGAYMYIAEPGMGLDDPAITDFAGRLVEWHTHSDLCWVHDGRTIGGIVGTRLPDGSCPIEGSGTTAVDPRVLTGEVPEGTLVDFGSFSMTHVWVVERLCGPFGALERPPVRSGAASPAEIAALCRHD